MMHLVGGKVVVDPALPPINDGVVQIEGTRITAVGKRSEFAADGLTDVIRCDGATVLPGLINCHVHLALNGDDEPSAAKHPRLKQMTDRELVSLYVEQAKTNLDAGVCTIRDLHPGPGGTTMGMLVLQEAIRRGHIDGSRVYLALRPLVMIGGHGTNWLSHATTGVEEVRKAVRENVAEGANVIKVMTSHRWGPLPNVPESQRAYFTRDELRVAVDEAHDAGVPISAHTHGPEAIRRNVELGFNSIEHGSGITKDVAELMAKQGTYLVPTLSSFQNFVDVAPHHSVPAVRLKEARYVVERQRSGFRNAIEAGVKIAAGTDAGFQFHRHGRSLVRELELYCELGMSPVEAMQTATTHASKLLNAQSDIGSLEPGKFADVLVVDGDATNSISALYDVRLVLKEGRVVRDNRRI